MKKLTRKILCFALSVFLLITMTTSAFAQEQQTINVSGYNFEVLDKDINGVKLGYSDDDGDYVFYLDKQNTSGKANIEIEKTNPLARNDSTENYQIIFDESAEYSPEAINFSSTILVDENSGAEYSLNENSRLAFIIPLGIPLIAAAIEALLIVGGVVIIAGIAYTIVEEVAEALKRQNQYRYYAAVLRNNAVYVGGALTTPAARTAAYSNTSGGTVLATTFSYATGLTGNSYRGPENHGSGSGYWSHIHAVRGGTAYKAHIWYL